MKILHLSDLHIGKKLNGYSLIEEQKYFFSQVYSLIRDKDIQLVIIAGDIYDRSIPSEDAILLLDEFLTELITVLKIKVIAITGNHDSTARLNFSNRILEKQGLYLMGEYKSLVNRVSIENIDFYLMPYIDPSLFRQKFREKVEEEELKISTHNDVMELLCSHASEDFSKRKASDSSRSSVCIYHGFVISRGEDAEEMVKEDSVKHLSVGGKEAVFEDFFSPFHYTALGHLHGCRKVKRDNIMYAGSPIKYSFSEINQQKKFVIVNVENGEVEIDTTTEIKELFPMHIVKGTIQEVLGNDIPPHASLKVILTEETLDAMNKLRAKYSRVMELSLEIQVKEGIIKTYNSEDIKNRTPLELFQELGESVGITLEEREVTVLSDLIDSIGEGDRK